MNNRKIKYTIFCKFSQRYETYTLTDYELISDGRLWLNCHTCNNYAIYISPEGINEKFRDRYFGNLTKKLKKKIPDFAFSEDND